MDTLKLNSLVVLMFLFFISCNKEKSYNCDNYIAAGEGFIISIKNFPEKELKTVEINTSNKKITWEHEKNGIYPYTKNFNITVSDKISIKDTLIIKIRNKIFKIYDFTNVVEEGFDKNHNKVKICRYYKSKINNKEIEDQGNNIILLDFEK